MTAYAVLRIAKLKSWGAIGGAGEHNTRQRETPNADPVRLERNRVLMGTARAELAQAVRGRIGNQTIRKNAVLAVEGVLSASSEYFRPDQPEKSGSYDTAQLERWVLASKLWLQNRYGDRVVSAVLHLDESTPHIQFVLVPLDDTGKLNCRALFGGSRHTLSDLQTDYAAAVAHLGIQRGLEGSRAKHQDVAKFYALTQARGDPELPVLNTVDLPNMPGKVARISDATLENYALATAENAAKAQREVAAPVVKALAKENAMLKQQTQDLRRANAALTQEQRKLRRETEQVRNIDPCDVLQRMYGGRETPDSKPHYKSRKFELPDGVVLGVTERLWVDNSTGKGGKGAINLVMYLSGYEQKDLKLAVRDLIEVFGEWDTTGDLTAALIADSPRKAAKLVKEVQEEPFRMPEPFPETWQRVRDYLCEERKLPPEVVDQAHDQGLVYSDNRANCVFARDQGTGVFKRGSGEMPFKQTLGREGLPFVLPGTNGKVYVTEAPIDALTLKSKAPKSTILATGGHMPIERLVPYLEGKEIFLAQDNDRPGKELARRLKERFPEAKRIVPKEGKDWNEQLLINLGHRPKKHSYRERLREKRKNRGIEF